MATAYKIDPAGENKFGTADLTDLTSFTYDEEGEEVLHNTDGSEFAGGAFVDDKRYRVAVNGSDVSVRPSVGDTGDLVLVARERANGDGTTGGALTFTFTGAVCVGTTGGVNHGGVSETTYNFVVPGNLVETAYIDPLVVT